MTCRCEIDSPGLEDGRWMAHGVLLQVSGTTPEPERSKDDCSWRAFECNGSAI